jgi:hypothetical protein
LPDDNPNTHSYWYTNCNSHSNFAPTNSYANGNGNSDSYGNCNADTHGNVNVHTHSYCYANCNADTHGNPYSYADANPNNNANVHTYSYCYTNCNINSNGDPDCYSNSDGYAHARPGHAQRAWLQSAGSTHGGPVMGRGDFKQHRRLP